MTVVVVHVTIVGAVPVIGFPVKVLPQNSVMAPELEMVPELEIVPPELIVTMTPGVIVNV